MTLENAAPAAFDPCAALQARLTDEEVVAYAAVVAETPVILNDARLAEAILVAIYQAPAPRLLLSWPDGSIGFAWLPPGKHIADAVAAAYTGARSYLEALHLEHTPPAALAWRN